MYTYKFIKQYYKKKLNNKTINIKSPIKNITK